MEQPDTIRKPPRPETQLPSTEAANVFADLIGRAGFGNERFVVTVYGKERAAIIGMNDLERLRSLDAA